MAYCIYLRKSRADRDFDSAGVEETLARHKKALLELAKRKGLSINAIYKEVVSGESIDSRPEMRRLLTEVEQGLWEGVLVIEIERLARGNTKDQGIIAEAFQFSDTKIITPSKTYDPNNEFDEEYFEFGLFMSRREYKAINRRIQRGRVTSAKEGKFLGSTPPFGYDKVKIKADKGYTLKPNENADIVRLIFDLYVNGKKLPDNTIKLMGHSLIAKELDSMSIPPPVSEKWSRASVKAIIVNPVYTGKIRWSYDKEIKTIENGVIKKTRKRNYNCILVDGLHEPIITEDLFNKAQNMLKSKKISSLPSDKALKNPLSGIVYCGKCGSLMTRKKSGSANKDTYILSCPNIYCSNISADIEIIEKAIVNIAMHWLEDYSLSWEKKQQEIKKNSVLTAKQKLIKKIYMDLKVINKQINSAYDLLEQGVYDVNKFTERISLLSDEKNKLETKSDKLKKEIKKDIDSQKMTLEYLPDMKKFIEVYFSLKNAADKNKILKEVFERIEYTKNKRAHKGKGGEARFQLKLLPKIPK